MSDIQRTMPVGAEPHGDRTHFRVWAPACNGVEVVLVGGREQATALEPEEHGFFSGFVGAGPGALYRYRLDGGDLFPDPASRFQPEGPHGPSEIVDPRRFAWSDDAWQGRPPEGQVFYEMHVGTFTREGTWDAARAHLGTLARLGITTLEVMPVADFAGAFGWGYDGVSLFAPTRLYGRPDAFRRFVDEAHGHGLAVVLDVVYNHLGADGNYLPRFAPQFFTDRYKTDWGPAINYDGDGSGPVRALVTGNAAYWIREFHLDGLRLDATQDVHDRSRPHILTEIGAAAREAGGRRRVYLVAENEPQDTRLVRDREHGGYGLDALWNDDFHHTALVALTGHRQAYYTDYLGSPQEFVSAAKRGYLYQGQRYAWQKKRRGRPSTGTPRPAFVQFLENHDQVANSSRGRRTHALASPGRHRALTALLLLSPATPLLFQGQEFSASTPFLYFADPNPEIAPLVRAGRREFLAQFPSLARAEWDDALPDPCARGTFERCILDHGERERHGEASALFEDLLRLRKEDAVVASPGDVDGAVLGARAFVLRLFGKEGDDRLLVVNLGGDIDLVPAPEPLLAPPEGRAWALLWSSEAPAYGGDGALHPETDDGWRLAGESAVLLGPGAARTEDPEEDG
jgi:maltooligosyltrehalose trehalohydrolase